MRDEGKKLFGDLTLKDAALIVNNTRKYLYYLRRCGEPAFEQIEITSGEDTERLPFEQTVSVYRRLDGNSNYLYEHQWHFVLGYEGVHSGDFDYIATVRRDNNTAYKTRPPGPPKEVKFRLTNYWHPNQTQTQLSLIAEDLVKLRASTDHLETATKDFESWAREGLGAAIICRTLFCREPREISIASIEKIAETAMTVEDFKSKLVCSKCGSKNISFVPAPSGDFSEDFLV